MAGGDRWVDGLGVISETMEKFSESTLEAKARVEQVGYDFTRLVLRPHDARMRGGAWWCRKCDGESCDPELLREVECSGDNRLGESR